MPQSCSLCRPKASGAAPKPDLLPDVLTVPGSCYRIGCERRTGLEKRVLQKSAAYRILANVRRAHPTSR